MITVIIPTLNEEKALGQVIESIPGREEMEILVVDGLSTDRTVEIAQELGARVVMEKRRGYGRAYKTGFAEAKGDIIATLDGDLTYPAEMIPELARELDKRGVDFISCDRLSQLEKEAMTPSHRLGNWVLKVATNILFGMKIADSQTGMWIFKKSVLDKITLTSDGMPLSEEIKIEMFTNPDVKAIEIAVPYRIRVGEIKLNSWADGRKNLMFLFRKRFGKLSVPEEEEGGQAPEGDSGEKSKPTGGILITADDEEE